MLKHSIINVPYLKNLNKQSNKEFNHFKQLLAIGLQNYQWAPLVAHKFWPFWARNQFNKMTNNHLFDNNMIALINNNQRNWTYLTQQHSEYAALIDPVGGAMLKGFPFTVECWLNVNDSLLIPCMDTPIDQTYDAATQSISTSFCLHGIETTSTCFITTNAQKNDLFFNQYVLKNISQSTLNFSFFIVLRPYTIEGMSDINNIQYLQSMLFLLNKKYGVYLDNKPDNVVCLALKDGDIAEHYKKLELIFNAKCPQNKAAAFAEYRLNLAPQNTTSVSLKIPFNFKQFPFSNTAKIQYSIAQLNNLSYSQALEKNKRFYIDYKKNMAKFDLPDYFCKFLDTQVAYLYSHFNTDMFTSGYYPEYNQSLSDQLEIRYCLYKLSTQKNSPYFSLPKNYFKFILRMLKKEPQFITQCADWFSLLSSLLNTNYLKLTPDHASTLTKIISHLIDQLDLNNSNSYYLPKKRFNFSSQTTEYFLADLLSIYLSIQCYVDIADQFSRELTQSKLYLTLAETLKKLKHSITYFCDSVSDKLALKPVIPVTLSNVNSIESINTLRLYLHYNTKSNSAVTNTLAFIESTYIQNGLVVSQVKPTGIPIKTTVQYFQVLTLLGQSNHFNQFNQLLALGSKTYSFPDASHPITRGGGGSAGDGHSLRSNIALTNFFIDSIVSQTNQSITLFSCIHKQWLTEHNFNLENINTTFGKLSIKLEQQTDTTLITINITKQHANKNLIINLYNLFDSFQISDMPISILDPVITIPLVSTTISLTKKHGTQ